uniref:SRPBCC domain-containing protein n=1 Tax=Gelidibacter sp. TaxID=2018083 RepID=UPI00404AE189
MNTKTITIDCVIKNNIQNVWNAYTEPQHIVNWNFASDDWHSPKAENDLKVGGTYCTRMEAKDGSFGFDFKAVYDEVQAQKSLKMTLEDSRKVTTLFESMDNAVKVTTSFEAENQNPIDIQKAGWQAILNNFKNYTEINLKYYEN